MLDLGFPVDHPERSDGYTPLHNAAWAGSGDLVELLIARGHPVDIRDPGHDATPLGYALYDCLVEKRHPEGEFARVVKALLEAGSPLKGVEYPTGDAAVDEVLRGIEAECARRSAGLARSRTRATAYFVLLSLRKYSATASE